MAKNSVLKSGGGVSGAHRAQFNLHLFRWMRDRFSFITATKITFALIFFGAGLSPSLIPREAVHQGILGGVLFGVGYACGAALSALWRYLELTGLGRWMGAIAVVGSLLFALWCLAMSSVWQNSIRVEMGMPVVEAGRPFLILGVATIVAVVLIAIGESIGFVVRWLTRPLRTVLTRRLALIASFAVVVLLLNNVVGGFVVDRALEAADAFFLKLDTVGRNDGSPPQNSLSSGSAASLVAWNTIGRDGRVYVTTGPNAGQIEKLAGKASMQPLRVYVGLNSARSLAERVQMALDEMDRVGAFNRSVLVVVMPVGTGWVDPPCIDSLEYLMLGDVASVALQYSYLSSPLSLVVQPERGTAAARALFKAVYNRWRAMPREARPKLYLSGLSLGAHASQDSTQIFAIIGEPYDGALWVGPPFTSEIWKWGTENRRSGSPEWLPRLDPEIGIRFTNSGALPEEDRQGWGPLRILFLQHPTDAIVFFSWASLYEEPDWMKGTRGPGVNAEFKWYPIVTFFQLSLDMALGQATPRGFGHRYKYSECLAAWNELIEPPEWTSGSLNALGGALDRATPAYLK